MKVNTLEQIIHLQSNQIFQHYRSLIEISPQRSRNSFMLDHNIRDLLGFNARTLYEEYTLSSNPVDILSFDNIFLERDFAQGMSLRGKRCGIIHNFTMDVNPGYIYIEKFRGNIQWSMMQSTDVISSFCFKVKNEKTQKVSFKGQSINFRLSIKEIYILTF